MTTDSRISDQQIAKTMPLPIALAWHRVTLATGPEARVQHAVAAFEVALRTVVAMQLADYLRSTPSERVEAYFDKLGKPSLGTWLGLARELVRALGQREVAPFVEPAYDAWFRRGKPGPALQSADEVVALRNKLQHGRASSGTSAWDGHARDLVSRVRQLLASLVWMESHRLLRVVAQEPTRRGTHRVQVQIFAGNQPLPQPVQAELDRPLFPSAVYLLSPDGQHLIEVSPLFFVAPAEGLGEDRLHLFRGVHRKGAFELAWDESGSELHRRADTDEGSATFAEWLQRRGSRDPVLQTSDHLGTLAVPVRRVERRQGLLAGRFELLGTLGEGGMAVVHRARDELTGEDVALKVLKSDLRDDAELRARFLREAATMRRAHSPRVITSVELGELEDGELYLRMPLFDGGTVRDRLEAGPVDSETRRQWAEDLLEALAHLASLGIVHRDVKPSNLLLDSEGRLVLGDFGVAMTRGEARLTRTMQHLGSLAYMAPEHRGDGQVTPAADVYSAALVLHEICVGEAPGSRPGIGVPGPVGEVIRSMGVLDVEERATAASALEHLRNPLAGALNLPLPSDDGRIAVVSLVITLLGWLAAWGASRVLHPAEIDGEWIPLSGVLLALLILPGVVAGTVMHRFGRAPSTRMGAWCGAWSTLGVWILGAAPFAQISALMEWFEGVRGGGRGLVQEDYGLLLAEPVLFSVLLVFALQPVVLLVGAGIGGLTGALLQRQFPRAVIATQLNPFLLEATATVPACLGAFVVGFAAWLAPWIGEAIDQMDADSPVFSTLVFIILVLPWIIALGVVVAQLVGWHALAMAYRRRVAEGAKRLAIANSVSGMLLLVLPMGCAAWMVATARPFPGKPALVGVLLGVGVFGAGWMLWQIRRLRTPPELQISSIDHWSGSVAAIALGSIQLLGPILALAAFFSIVAGGTRASMDGRVVAVDQLLAWVERSWLVLALCVPATLGVGAFGGAISAVFFSWRNARTRRARWGVMAGGVSMTLLGCGMVLLDIPLVQAIGNVPTGQDVPWPHPTPPGEEEEGTVRLKDTYRGGARALMHVSAESRYRVRLERDASWLEAAVALALLREEDGVPPDLAWAEARALAVGTERLDDVVRAWPVSDALLHDAVVDADPLLQVLHASLAARGHVDADHAERFPQTFDALFVSGRRLPLPYLLRLRAVSGSGIPDSDALAAGDAVARDAIEWMGELDDALLAARVRINLRANEERMAHELLSQRVEARGPWVASMLVEVGIRVDDLALTEAGLDPFRWLDPDYEPTSEEVWEAELSGEPERRVPARAVADAATALALAGRLDEADQLLRRAHDHTPVGLKRAVLADRHRAIALVNEQPTSLWDARGEPSWPVDSCVQAGMAALAGEGDWSAVSATGPEAVCHFQGVHLLWRDRAR